MKSLMLSTFELQGGAARSAHRLYQQLGQMGVESRMLVQYRTSDDQRIMGGESLPERLAGKFRPYLDGLPLLLYRSRFSPPWSLAWLSKNIDVEMSQYAPDLIHIHGIGHGFLSLSNIVDLSKPLIWTMHDSWAFTGGCHLPGACDLYRVNCGFCPQLNALHERDLSRWVWNRKAFCWPTLDVTFVAPSNWLAQCARSSSLLGSRPIEVIPNGIDAVRFVPGDRAIARDTLGLPQKGVVLLYGASSFTHDSNKGYILLKDALSQVAESLGQKSLTVALFGDPDCKDTEIYGIPVQSYGAIKTDEKLISLYRAADLFVLPSQQENLPNTVLEAMACGTPCVAFNVGGVRDLIFHGENGYITNSVDVHELAAGIIWMMADSDRRAMMGRQARKTVETGFALNRIAERYLYLYARIIARRKLAVGLRRVDG